MKCYKRKQSYCTFTKIGLSGGAPEIEAAAAEATQEGIVIDRKPKKGPKAISPLEVIKSALNKALYSDKNIKAHAHEFIRSLNAEHVLMKELTPGEQVKVAEMIKKYNALQVTLSLPGAQQFFQHYRTGETEDFIQKALSNKL